MGFFSYLMRVLNGEDGGRGKAVSGGVAQRSFGRFSENDVKTIEECANSLARVLNE